MFMYPGLNSISLSMLPNRPRVPAPLSGGNTSNEKAVFDDEFM
jgi:hypothetical protein